MPWKTDSKARPKSGADCIPVPVLSYEAGIAKGLDSRSSARVLRTQGRSYSCPVSPLDIVIPPTLDVFTPIPLPVHRPFDDLLPREVKLHVFKLLVLSHEQEYEKRIADGNWTALKASASRNRWVGKDKGVRELVKFSRVSKSWRSLVFDGQLWSELAVTAFPKLPLPALSRVVSQSGAFMSTIDLTGHTTLSPESLFKLNHSLCISPALPDNQAVTQLKNINLQGCTALTTRSLHDLLIRSPHLENLCLKGLSVVNNTTCELLSTHCRSLVSLNLNRCLNLNAGGLHSLVSGASARGERLRLKELRISGLKYITDTIMAAMGKAMPHLEVLDLSYTRDLHNSALDAFVSLPLEEDDPNSIVLTSREIGRDPGDVTKYRRRVTRLRHLSLSHCLLLTDIACSNLAHCVPRLELFEMAGIGGHLNDEGLIRMLNTTPHIRKIDLEDAMDISDAVLRSLTPVNHSPSQRKSPETPQVGQELEHLVVSYAVNITNEALLGLIRNCPRLRVLEADSTRMTGKTLQEFVRLAHSRRMADAGVVAIDCRGVSESAVTDVSKLTRPRLGWRAHEAKKLAYLDARDDEDLGVGQDECDDKRVVVKTFYSWETVDAVRVARDRKRKTRRALNSSGSSAEDYFSSKSPGRSKWWAPGGRRRSGNNSPSLLDVNNDRDGCTIM
ncbi:RNI-like protein [Gloeophyllum trabeum ATCC 11539]|uniref:RNI-like protein n=1 Tax=Gloeophyllum trabeum (strain ATCC 11539 / FP-39264 / Madison 617) TaxID=670483 RepID=S7QLM6_GLOTA|nr:RNI-like protein [Gloeophyllum trabeum ATCC 11539]EPQ60313.1 RNI-like protein [Gloeophyllum trabeum ATCC 11539]